MASTHLPPDARIRAADLFNNHATALRKKLARRYPGVDPALVHDAAIGAILLLSAEPQRFDPTRGDLPAFLLGIARRMLRTLRRTAERARRREQNKFQRDVTERSPVANSPVDELIEREQFRRCRDRIARTEEERLVLDLMLLGEQDLARYAEVLPIGHLAPARQQARVDAVRARLRQRLSRLRRQYQEEDPPP